MKEIRDALKIITQNSAPATLVEGVDEKVYRHKGNYGYQDQEDQKPAVKRGRGRPAKTSDEGSKFDFSAFGSGKEVKLPKHKGKVTSHKMIGENASVDRFLATAADFGYNVDKLSSYELNNFEYGDVYKVTHYAEGSDYERLVARVEGIEAVVDAIKDDAAEHEPTMPNIATSLSEEAEEDGKIEAYGVKGMKSTPWRKVFKNQAAFEKWLDANEGDVEVHGTRFVDDKRVSEEVKTTKTGRINKGNYGYQDQEDQKPAVKRGRGRPSKSSEEGEGSKFDFSALSGKKPNIPAFKGKTTQHKIVGEEATDKKEKDVPFEAYGVKGAKSTKWRKTFKTQAAFEKWLDANEGDVEVYGTRDLEGGKLSEETKETKTGRIHKGSYGTSYDDKKKPETAVKRGRGRPSKSSEEGEGSKFDFSALGGGKKVNLPAHKGKTTQHKMVGEGKYTQHYMDANSRDEFKPSSEQRPKQAAWSDDPIKAVTDRAYDKIATMFNKKREMSESSSDLSDATAKGIIDGSIDLHDAMITGEGVDQAEQQYLVSLYNDLAGEYGLHPDDDFEEIEEIIIQQLASESGYEAPGANDVGSEDEFGDEESMGNLNESVMVGTCGGGAASPTAGEKVEVSAAFLMDILKLAGLQPATAAAPIAPVSPAPALPAPSGPAVSMGEPSMMEIELPNEIPVDEELANSPDPEMADIDDLLAMGDDMHAPKSTYPKVAGGDNPMQPIAEDLWAKYMALKNRIK